jgi:hypothetical protein
MSNIRIVENAMSINMDSLHNCHLDLISHLKVSLEKIDVQKALSERSKTFKVEIENAFRSDSLILWKKQPVFSSPEFHDVPAGLQIDARGVCTGNCNSFHEVNIVLCLNNREIIGTNFLKLEVSAQEEIRNHSSRKIYDSNILGLLITFDDSILKAGNWDPAYGDANEYTFAYQFAYRGLIKSNIISLQLNLV